MATRFEKLFEDYKKAKVKHEELTKQLIEEVNKRLEGKVSLSIKEERSLESLEKTDEGMKFHYYEVDYNERHPVSVIL